jgi:SAM-dependent methyltransferase
MRLIENERAEWAFVEDCIRSKASPDRPIRILEAGCGRRWFFDMHAIRYELTGVDLDAAALEARKTIGKDLHHALLGDLRTVELEAQSFDVIYSSYVLEHVAGADRVLENFTRWIKPGGIIIIRVPDRDSVQGFTTRWTPFWLHVLYYRYVEGQKNAGKPGFAPYPTVYDSVISSRGMHRFAQAHGLELREEVRHGDYKRGSRLFQLLIGLYARGVTLVSLGRVHSQSSNLTFILEKPAAVLEKPARREQSAAPAAA